MGMDPLDHRCAISVVNLSRGVHRYLENQVRGDSENWSDIEEFYPIEVLANPVTSSDFPQAGVTAPRVIPSV